MYKSAFFVATLLAAVFCPLPASSATSDSIFSAGLMSPSGNDSNLILNIEQQSFGFTVGFVTSPFSQEDNLLSNHTHADTNSSQAHDAQLSERAWLPDNLAFLAEMSEEYPTLVAGAYTTSHSRDRVLQPDAHRKHSFSFRWEPDNKANDPWLLNGLRQYLAVENAADFDLRVLNGRVINIAIDPLEYSIINDLCFIKHCFF